ncbi:MAG: hypothetical protein ACFBZ9_13430 [Sphingomonadales bacterium]
MHKQSLVCKFCHTPISIPLCFDDTVRPFDFARQDDSIAIPKGWAWRVEPLHFHPFGSRQIWFSPASLLDTVITNRNTFGCCGHTGQNNTRSRSGYAVGSRIDECGHQPRFEPNPKNTYWAASHLIDADPVGEGAWD